MSRKEYPNGEIANFFFWQGNAYKALVKEFWDIIKKIPNCQAEVEKKIQTEKTPEENKICINEGGISI